MPNLQHEETRLNQSGTPPLYAYLKNHPQTKAAFLFGSVARGDDNCHSDIDIALWVDKTINIDKFTDGIKEFLGKAKIYVFAIPRKNSIFIFTDDLKKIDILIAHQLNDLNRNYMGSSIPAHRIFKTIIFDKTDSVLSHLKKINKEAYHHPDQLQVPALINYFLFNFENCSKHHAKSDGYQFYFNYNIALHTLIQLHYYSKGNTQFLYNPKNIAQLAWRQENMEELYQLKGSIFLPEANQKKRLLLDRFYEVARVLMPEQFDSHKRFCENIYARDYFWNFRDYNLHDPNLPKGKIIRSATLSLFKDDHKVIELLNKNNIDTIVDLRAPKEIKETPYAPSILKGRKYIQAPFDPWNQPDWFKENHQQGTNREIAYRFFLMAC